MTEPFTARFSLDVPIRGREKTNVNKHSFRDALFGVVDATMAARNQTRRIRIRRKKERVVGAARPRLSSSAAAVIVVTTTTSITAVVVSS